MTDHDSTTDDAGELSELVQNKRDAAINTIVERGYNRHRLEELCDAIETAVYEKFAVYDRKPSPKTVALVQAEMLTMAIEHGETESIDFDEHFEQLEDEMLAGEQSAMTNVGFVLGTLTNRPEAPPEIRELTNAVLERKYSRTPSDTDDGGDET